MCDVLLLAKLNALDTYDANVSRLDGKYIGIHITCNEDGVVDTCRRLRHLAPCENQNTCHVGFSGWFNLDVIVCRQSSFAVLCDVNPAQSRFMRLTLDKVRQHRDRFDFCDAMFREGKTSREVFSPYVDTPSEESALQRDDLLWCGGAFLAKKLLGVNVDTENVRAPRKCDGPEYEMRSELTRADSWCGTWRAYDFIRSLVLKSSIVILTCDLTDTKRIQSVADCLQSHNMKIDTVYTSNIRDYCASGSDILAYNASLDVLLHASSTLLVASQRPLRQHLHFGRLR